MSLVFEPIDLDTPISAKGGEIRVLTPREPNAQQLFMAYRPIEGGSNPESESLFARELVAASTGLATETCGELPESVLAEIADRVLTAIEKAVAEYEHDDSQDAIMLDPAITISNIDYTRIDVREPRGNEVIKANSHLRTSQGPASQTQHQMSLVSQVSGIPPAIVMRLPASTLMIAYKVIAGFTRAGRRTGAS